MIKKLHTILARDGFIYTSKRSLAWLLARIPGTQSLGFRFYKQYTLGFSRSMLTYVLFAAKEARNEDTLVLERCITPGAIVVDIGAHIGSMSIIAASLAGDTGTVLAFEPSPKFAEILRQNVCRNGLGSRITIIPKAVGATFTTTHINEAVADDTTNHIDTVGTLVEQTTLDLYTKALPRIDFLKIDVEGYELEVLLGATETLLKTSIVYIEFYSKNLRQSGYEPADIITLLRQHFNLSTFDSTNNALIPFNFNAQETYMVNLIAVRK